MLRTVTIVYTSATGHTEFVIETLMKCLEQHPGIRIVKQKAESTQPEDLKKGDVLVLACGSWNTGGAEGQLSTYMHDLLTGRASQVDLQGKMAAAIGLGDDRYYFVARAADKLTEYLQQRGAKLLLPTLKIVNDPFDQTKRIEVWAKELEKQISVLPTTLRQKKKS